MSVYGWMGGGEGEEKQRERETYFLLEEACTILTHSGAVDAWSSQVPKINHQKRKKK